ncbi:hypothetical protein DYB37_009838 [Aphanomyces astaci]|uniref:Plectin/eS10 N-terminal domain-containing protein n=1 Tax=Aphanomyces astaci TaxID=112090 RepID=A0A397F0E1_APHAT|nr:hypothetical protein DYB31_007556 [Aphanomyces astaci]RHZ16860.1 hypothetical protein DYB37_009838 [Aphanomyces astaci]RQM21242.1 hypothetical protein B5M09_009069 [Aphanomyces astaci]
MCLCRGCLCPPHSLRLSHIKREWHDPLILTNLVYVAASVISFALGQYTCAVLQLGASVASSMFHRHRETKYLPLDACISGNLGLIALYLSYHAHLNDLHHVLGIKFGLGLACAFTFIYCGMPGDAQYELWHRHWHFASGSTTLVTSVLLSLYIPDFDYVLNRIAVYSYLFKEGVMVGKKDFFAPKHGDVDVPNLQVIKLLQSLHSRGYVKETFNWQWYYWYLTAEGIEYLRAYLHLPTEIVPATLKKQAARPQRPQAPTGAGGYGRGKDKNLGPSGDFNPEFRGRNQDGYRREAPAAAALEQ